MAAALGKISDVANSVIACGRYIPGKRWELPEESCPSPAVRSTTRHSEQLTLPQTIPPYRFLTTRKRAIVVWIERGEIRRIAPFDNPRKGMAEQKNSCWRKRDARNASASGVAGTILPPGLAIPCWVAPLQSPTPFHQAKDSIARNSQSGADCAQGVDSQNRQKRLPGPSLQNRQKRLSARWPENRQKRLSARYQETTRIPGRQIGILGIIVKEIHPQPIHC